jgi:hypothetical protein
MRHGDTTVITERYVLAADELHFAADFSCLCRW